MDWPGPRLAIGQNLALVGSVRRGDGPGPQRGVVPTATSDQPVRTHIASTSNGMTLSARTDHALGLLIDGS